MQETTQDRWHEKPTVIVVNPKHFAVGIYYKMGKIPLPKITVRGADKNAQNIIKIAENAGIPIFQDPQLAQSLFKRGLDDNFVPTDLLPSVAAVLRWVNQLKNEE